MAQEKNKITVRQTLIIFGLSTLSPAIRLFPTICAKKGHSAGWLAPLFGAAALFILFLVLAAIFKNKEVTSLSDAFERTLGKTVSKILLAIYLFWLVIIYFMFIRYYAERLLSSIYPNTDLRFFLICMLSVIFIVARRRIDFFARFCELSFLIFLIVLLIFYVLLIPTIKIDNVFPVTHMDFVPVLDSSFQIVSIWGFAAFFFFLGDHIKNKDQILKHSKKAIFYLCGITILILFFIIGSLGADATARMPLPFFNSTKLINIMPAFDRFEAVLLSIWVISDFILIVSFMIIIISILKKITGTSEPKYFASPLTFIGYIGGLFIANSRFELEWLSSAAISSIIICVLAYGIPFGVLILGKVRKTL